MIKAVINRFSTPAGERYSIGILKYGVPVKEFILTPEEMKSLLEVLNEQDR